MTDPRFKALAQAKAKVVKLEAAIAKTRSRELASLPVKYGFDSVAEFTAAVLASNRGSRPKKSASKPAPAARKTRKRVEITDAIRGKVLELVRADKSGSEIAAAVGISLPSVQNIKKAAGLVKSRVPKAAQGGKNS